MVRRPLSSPNDGRATTVRTDLRATVRTLLALAFALALALFVLVCRLVAASALVVLSPRDTMAKTANRATRQRNTGNEINTGTPSDTRTSLG